MNAPPPKYWAFISYSHRDSAVAAALHRALETYRLPKRLVGRTTAQGVVPMALKPIFRDRDELHASTDLKAVVHQALTQSRYLIVVCSPDAARSAWVNQEIVEFKKAHGESRVLAVIARGEPFASFRPDGEAEECFPPALRSEVTSSGFADGPALEPIAADLRAHGDGKRRATLKLIAGMVGVGIDELIQRDAARRARQLMFVAAASIAGMAAMTVLAVAAVRARNEARVQRSEAEDLVEFMLGDLRQRLNAVGRLDVLDSVGLKALEYYSRQDPDQLDSNALGGRARALHLIGEMREQRGQLDAAQAAFARAADMTEHLLARSPRNGQRIFDHAQSVYWVGHLAWLRGQSPQAESAFREYVSLADRLVQLNAGKPEWQAELAYAHVNVGVVYTFTGRATEALPEFAQSRTIWQQQIQQQPRRVFDLANCLGWIAKAQEARGDLAQAIETQKEKMAVLGAVPDAPRNQVVQRHLRVTNGELARLHLAMGRVAEARPFALTAVQAARAQVALDPRNTSWLEQLYVVETFLAEIQLAAGDRTGASQTVQEAFAGTTRLLTVNSKMVDWQVSLRGACLWLAARLASDDERLAFIAQLKQYVADVQQYATADRSVVQPRDFAIARAESQLAAFLAQAGQPDEATTHWRAVVARLKPHADAGDLPALTTLAIAEAHLGAVPEARAMRDRIASTPFRHPAYAELVQLLADHAGSAPQP